MNNPNDSEKRVAPVGIYSSPVFINGVDATVTAIPGSGGTVTVQSTTSPREDVRNGSATWANWTSGAVASIASSTLVGKVTAVRATAATADGVMEVCQ